ncbi:hypothetical protein BH20ACI3_BH20ACI3_08930 [soil metagenome]
MSRQPGYEHQYTCNRLGRLLDEWNDQNNLGVVLTAPGLIFAEDDSVSFSFSRDSRGAPNPLPENGRRLLAGSEPGNFKFWDF